MLTTREAARLLAVSPRTVLKWIERDTVPYVTLPNDGSSRTQYRIPLPALIDSLSGNYTWDEDVLAELEVAPAEDHDAIMR